MNYLNFLQVFDQIWLLHTFKVTKKSRIATFVLRAKFEKLVSKLRITENIIMKNCNRATDMMTKLMAGTFYFLQFLRITTVSMFCTLLGEGFMG